MNNWKKIGITIALLLIMEQIVFAMPDTRCFFAFTNVTGNRLLSVLINGESINLDSQWMTWSDNQAKPVNFIEKQKETDLKKELLP